MAFGAEVAELIVALRLDDKGFSGKLNSAQRNLKGFGAGLSQMGKGAGQVASGVDKIATRAAIAGAGLVTFAATTAASFETAFTGVRKTVDGTEAELADLEESLRSMAREGIGSFEELSAIGEQGGALGIALNSIDEFTDVVARLAMSTDLSADQAATALGQLGNVLQLSGADYEKFSDILVALGNDGASTEGQIIDLAARFGAAGNAAGLTNEQILTLASTTASMGIEAEAGGGALSRVFNNLTLDMATASDEGVLLADTLGMSLDDLKRAWDEDAGQVFEDLLAHINKLDQFEAAEFLSNLGITNTRDINAIRLLSQGVEEYRDQLATAESAQGALREESDKFLATSERQWFRLQQNVRDAAATIGAELLPVINEVVTEIVDWLQEPGTQKGIKEFGENLASGVRDLVREVKNADFGPLLETLKGAAGIAKAGFDAFNALPSGVKSLALAAFGINKLTGGALGDIAKGFGNIFAGGLKILFERGASPANPLWVQTVGGGLGGGPGGMLGGRGGKPFLPTGQLGWLGAGATWLGAVAAWSQAIPLAEETRKATARGQAQLVEIVQDRTQDANLRELEQLRSDLKSQIQADMGDPLSNFVKWLAVNPTLEDQLKSVDAKIAALNSDFGTRQRPAAGPRNPGTDAAGADAVLTQNFGGKLDKLATKEVIEHLARTNEIGLEGVGTSFQVGLKNGLDPVGDVATRILEQARHPKAPEVMFEIKGHLNGLEEIQAQYLANGDVKLAQKVQDNIDTLHGLIGTTDEVRAVTQKLADDARSNDAAMLQTARNNTGRTVAAVQEFNQSEGTRFANLGAKSEAQKAAIQALNSSEGTRAATLHALTRDANAKLGRTASASEITSRKKFDPKITTNVTTHVGINVTAGMSVIATKLYQLKQTVNAGSPELRGSI